MSTDLPLYHFTFAKHLSGPGKILQSGIKPRYVRGFPDLDLPKKVVWLTSRSATPMYWANRDVRISVEIAGDDPRLIHFGDNLPAHEVAAWVDCIYTLYPGFVAKKMARAMFEETYMYTGRIPARSLLAVHRGQKPDRKKRVELVPTIFGGFYVAKAAELVWR